MDDKEIIRLFREPATCHSSFNHLMDKYKVRLYWLIRRMVNDHSDTDDILQEVFIKVWQKLGEFREESNLYTWLYRIAVNQTLNFLSRANKHKTLRIEDEPEAINKGTGIDYVNGDEITARLEKAIVLLPERQRLVFNMRYYDEMTYEQMSEVLGTSVGALKASYHHAVRKVENFLTGPH